jgi:ATP adenylyltransferase
MDKTKPWTNPIYSSLFSSPIEVYEDKYPVSPGHRLYVPTHNTAEMIALAFEDAFRYGRAMVESKQWDGFNVGLNYGDAAGQTIEWPHVHLIPRFKNDVEDPTGGIRNVIPGKGKY